jgi:NAD+ diphosphatase
MSKETNFFKFCPNCANQNFSYDNNFKFHCHDCDFVLYHNIAAAVAVIFTFEDKILFTVRNVDPDKGKLDLPGGFIDPNETAEAAACREIKEELGLTVTLNDIKYTTSFPNNYIYKNVAYRTMDIFYECALKSDNISVASQDEIQELIWVKRSEIDLDKIGFVSIRKVIGAKYI